MTYTPVHVSSMGAAKGAIRGAGVDPGAADNLCAARRENKRNVNDYVVTARV